MKRPRGKKATAPAPPPSAEEPARPLDDDEPGEADILADAAETPPVEEAALERILPESEKHLVTIRDPVRRFVEEARRHARLDERRRTRTRTRGTRPRRPRRRPKAGGAQPAPGGRHRLPIPAGMAERAGSVPGRLGRLDGGCSALGSRGRHALRLLRRLLDSRLRFALPHDQRAPHPRGQYARGPQALLPSGKGAPEAALPQASTPRPSCSPPSWTSTKPTSSKYRATWPRARYRLNLVPTTRVFPWPNASRATSLHPRIRPRAASWPRRFAGSWTDFENGLSDDRERAIWREHLRHLRRRTGCAGRARRALRRIETAHGPDRREAQEHSSARRSPELGADIQMSWQAEDR